MTLEETITEAVQRAVAPLVESNRRLADQVEQLRRALPAQLVSIPGAAKRLGISEKTIRRRIDAGELPIKRIGARVLIDLAAMHAPSDDEVARAVHEFKHGSRG